MSSRLAATRGSIVVASDEPPQAREISRLLRASGFDVADVGLDAAALPGHVQEADVVVLSAARPEADLAALVQRVKLLPPLAPLVVVHLRAGTAEAVRRLLDNGADGYLSEPLDPRQALATVRALVNLRRLLVELRQSEERFDLLVEHAPALITAVDADEHIVLFNRACEQLTGWARAEVLGRPLMDLLVPPGWHRVVRGWLREAGREPAAPARESPWLTRWGGERTIEWRCFTIPGPAGSRRTACVGDDVTERRQAERRHVTKVTVRLVLAEAATAEAAIPRLLEAIGEGLGWDLGEAWRADPGAGALGWAGAWHARWREAWEFEVARREHLFARGEGLPGRVWATGEPDWTADLVGPGEPAAAGAAAAGFRSALAFPLGAGPEIEGVMVFFSRAVLPRDQDLLKMMADVGAQIGLFLARRRAEAALGLSQQRARRLFERSLAGIFRHDPDGRMLECNEAFARMLGYGSPEEVRGRAVDEVYHRPADWPRLRRTLDAGQVASNVALRLRRADGTPVWVLMNAARVEESGTAYYEGFVSGLTPSASSP